MCLRESHFALLPYCHETVHRITKLSLSNNDQSAGLAKVSEERGGQNTLKWWLKINQTKPEGKQTAVLAEISTG